MKANKLKLQCQMDFEAINNGEYTLEKKKKERKMSK